MGFCCRMSLSGRLFVRGPACLFSLFRTEILHTSYGRMTRSFLRSRRKKWGDFRSRWLLPVANFTVISWQFAMQTEIISKKREITPNLTVHLLDMALPPAIFSLLLLTDHPDPK